MVWRDHIGFLVTTQILAGFLMGPAVTFGQIYGGPAYTAHVFICAIALILYCAWMFSEVRSSRRRFSSANLRNGLVATLLFCMVGTAIVAQAVLGLENRLEPLIFEAVSRI